ncbi:aldose epimerase family protein [Sphingomonas sp.]|uniref:aldose epimerase family protein n=1 Tax=Sphingomonas sp. TaxID=28214 RepID=UPI001B1821F0|nr:aldose epimerase family protein [Sphingomonas sp.]MBO9712983.1 galactose mutarotase [Sphingomonas sp.]
MEEDVITPIEIANGPYRAQLLNLGAALRRLDVPGRDGKPADVTLGYRDLAEYQAHPRFYGAVAGRYANRIGGAAFTLDGQAFHIPANNGANNLHSGPGGFDQVFWHLKAHDGHSATYSHQSPAGHNGFPGNLEAEVTYTLERDGLAIRFRAATDAPTVVNLTHHAYFNLEGEASASQILDHWLQIPASRYTPTDPGQIPTGELASVEGSPLDFRTPKQLGRDIGADHPAIAIGHGYDHNFVLDAPAGTLRRVATAWDPTSGRVLEVHSDQPGVQLYTGNHLAGGAQGTSGATYPARGGFCLEPQKFPDSPNKPNFPSSRLDPGQIYEHNMAFRFRLAASVAEAFGG